MKSVSTVSLNTPVEETINLIIDQIYGKGRLTPICSKLILNSLLKKLLTEVTFTLDNCYFKQADGRTMGGPLSVSASDIGWKN